MKYFPLNFYHLCDKIILQEEGEINIFLILIKVKGAIIITSIACCENYARRTDFQYRCPHQRES